MGKSLDKPALLGGPKAVSESIQRYVSTGQREIEAAVAVLKSGTLSGFVGAPGPYFMGGHEVRALEQAWTAHFGCRHAISLNSATSGLHAALAAAGVRASDEVIVPPQTMSATATAVVMAGGTPVFVDQEETTSCLDPSEVAEAMGPKTKAIVVANIFGGPAQVLKLRELADRHGAILIEDNAQAPGGRHHDRWLGTIGHMGVFSLNFHKAIQCGEGGVVVTDDDRLARRLAMVRNHGENVAAAGEDDDIVGYNYRLTELQAAIARVQLDRLEELTKPRIEIATALDRGLAEFKAIRTARLSPGDRHVYYVYPIWLDPKVAGLSRDLFVEALRAEGCPVAPGYVRPLYRLPLFQKLARDRKSKVAGPGGLCPNAERAHFETFISTNLPEVPGGLDLVPRFIEAVAKVLAHAPELAQKAAKCA